MRITSNKSILMNLSFDLDGFEKIASGKEEEGLFLRRKFRMFFAHQIVLVYLFDYPIHIFLFD